MHLDRCGFDDAIRMLAREWSREPKARSVRSVATAAAAYAPGDPNAHRRLALAIWDEAQLIAGTLGETYLQGRGLVLPERVSQAVRFHPSCRFGGADRHPALVALWRRIAGDEPVAIHRRPLSPDGDKLSTWQALGPIGGAAIKLDGDEAVGQGLTIGEGLETVLAGMALGFRPAWGAGTAGGIRCFPVLSGIECLTILVDHDAPDRNGRRAGPDAAAECSTRWTAAGREVRRIMPRRCGADMADLS
jgi:hypothetical protein